MTQTAGADAQMNSRLRDIETRRARTGNAGVAAPSEADIESPAARDWDGLVSGFRLGQAVANPHERRAPGGQTAEPVTQQWAVDTATKGASARMAGTDGQEVMA